MNKRNIFFPVFSKMVLFLFLTVGWPLTVGQAQPAGQEGNWAVSPEQRVERARQRWEQMTPEQREEYRGKMERWENLDPQQKKKIRQRFEQYQNLPSQEKEMIRQNWKKYHALDENQRERIQEKYEKWENLSPEKRRMIKERRRHFESLSPEEKQRIREKRKKWKNLDEGKKNEIRKRMNEGSTGVSSGQNQRGKEKTDKIRNESRWERRQMGEDRQPFENGESQPFGRRERRR